MTPHYPDPASQPGDAARSILEQGYQVELPPEFIVPAASPSLRLELPGAGWIAAGLALLVLLWLGRDLLRGRGRPVRSRTAREAAGAPAGSAAREDPRLADALAALEAGQAARAIHLFLLCGLGELAATTGRGPAAATARELAREAPPGDASEALGELVRAVEHTRYAARPPGPGLAARCHERYLDLRRALGGGH